jgi:hypothetical protein
MEDFIKYGKILQNKQILEALDKKEFYGDAITKLSVLQMRQLLKTKVIDMDLSVRALNCLKVADVETLGELVSLNKNDILKFRNYGKKTLTELEVLVQSTGLQFGMNVSRYRQSTPATCPTTTFQDVIDWFRVKKNIHIYTYLNSGKDGYCVSIEYCNFKKDATPVIPSSYEDYYEAVEKAIKEALKLI